MKTREIMGSDRKVAALQVFGILVLIGGIILLFMGIYYYTVGLEDYTADENENAGFMLTTCCGIPGLVLGLILLTWAYYYVGKAKPLKDITNILRGYRVIHISEVAKRINKDDYQTEQLILKCISEGYVKGYINPKTREFVLDPSMGSPYYQIPTQPVSHPQPLTPQRPPPSQVPAPVAKKPLKETDECPTCGGLLFYSRRKKKWYCPVCE
jgi:hypothetical protein